MRKFLFLFLLFAAVLPVRAAEQVTVDQLERMLADARGKRDQVLAKQLGGMELSERLNSVRLAKIQSVLPEKKITPGAAGFGGRIGLSPTSRSGDPRYRSAGCRHAETDSFWGR